MGSLAVFSLGLMRLKDEMRQLSGHEPRFTLFSAAGQDAIGGWGHKPTAARARAAASRHGLPYIAFEDGFIRSLRPGTGQKPASMVIDRTGIYYDARRPSDLENLLQTAAFSADEMSQAAQVMAAIKSGRLSKYNHGVESLGGLKIPPGRKVVLVIDQTAGDESVAGGLADAARFVEMAEAAAAENPGAILVAKLHPETLSGAKAGYLEAAARRLGMEILASHVSPWCLFDLGPHVYTVSSQFGFEALMAGCKVTCFGMPFYAGWGLTSDRYPIARRTARRGIDELAAAVYLRYSHHFDLWRRVPVDALTAIDQMAFLRRSFMANTRPVVGYRIARWKRRAISVMCDGPGGPAQFTRSLSRAKSLARNNNAILAAWGREAIRLRPAIESDGLTCAAVEDGFLRSVGLGAIFVQPMSLVFDERGIYFDPTRPSDVEHILASGSIAPRDAERARLFRAAIAAARVTKYNVMDGASDMPSIPAGRVTVLVPGQVADDAAVEIGRPPGFPAGDNVNAMLLERARMRHPEAFVIFKPHPDVEHLGRPGALGKEEERHADHVARKIPLDRLFPIANHIETYSSLAGFEALLRGIPVSVHGMPFYAGWGLTEDLAPSSRRGRSRSLDELAAAALLLYPRYWDPISGLVCPPEMALKRITEARQGGNKTMAPWRLMAGRAVIAAKRLARWHQGTRHDT